MKRLGTYLSLVKFGHSIFALPFALQGAWLAAGGMPSAGQISWIVVAAVCARTAAMAFNRLVDRQQDAANPRTAGRELPTGKLVPAQVAALVAAAALGFVGASFALNPLAGRLSLPVLTVLLAYSFFKRFSVLAHAVLGLGLALAPLGAWIAVRGNLQGDLRPILLLAAAVWSWVAGFDLIYACQDADFDRHSGLHSVPARFGVRRALTAARVSHLVTIACLAAFTASAELSWIYWTAVCGAALLLAWEHSLVAPDDLSRVNVAFFTLNGWVGVALFVGLVLDMQFLSGGGA